MVQPAKAVAVLEGLSITEIADATGYSRAWVSRVLSGQVPAPAKFKAKLADFFDLPEHILFLPETETR